MDIGWAVAKLDAFILATEPDVDSTYWGGSKGNPLLMSSIRWPEDQVIEKQPVVDAILDRVMPGWKDEPPTGDRHLPTRWSVYRDIALRCKSLLQEREDIKQYLGDAAPDLSASRLHTWVWDAARSSWNAGLHTQAVLGALARVNAEAKRKGQRPDISESDLFRQLFSTDPPKARSPRLRLCDDSNPDTFRSRHAGAASYAAGLYMAVRNYLSHEIVELSEDEALEQLAAVSVLARWVAEARLEYAR